MSSQNEKSSMKEGNGPFICPPVLQSERSQTSVVTQLCATKCKELENLKDDGPYMIEITLPWVTRRSLMISSCPVEAFMMACMFSFSMYSCCLNHLKERDVQVILSDFYMEDVSLTRLRLHYYMHSLG